mmetsp:Transcript_22414/g.60142  ORF Transcript_22414/g.60142 Transcript_22414/m.60142 type:complete len:341 (-) Transcript_22414:97-1119(-)
MSRWYSAMPCSSEGEGGVRSRGRTPSAEQGGSSRMRSKEARGSTSAARVASRQRASTTLPSCSRATSRSSCCSLATERSHASTRPVGRVPPSLASRAARVSSSVATCVALPPGAAVRSRMRSPGRGSTTWATSADGRFWRKTTSGSTPLSDGVSYSRRSIRTATPDGGARCASLPKRSTRPSTAVPLPTWKAVAPRSATPTPRGSFRPLLIRAVGSSTITEHWPPALSDPVAAMAPGAKTSAPRRSASPARRSTTSTSGSSGSAKGPLVGRVIMSSRTAEGCRARAVSQSPAASNSATSCRSASSRLTRWLLTRSVVSDGGLRQASISAAACCSPMKADR